MVRFDYPSVSGCLPALMLSSLARQRGPWRSGKMHGQNEETAELGEKGRRREVGVLSQDKSQRVSPRGS